MHQTYIQRVFSDFVFWSKLVVKGRSFTDKSYLLKLGYVSLDDRCTRTRRCSKSMSPTQSRVFPFRSN